MSLYNKDLEHKGNKLMVHRRELASKPLPDSKTPEAKENEEMSLFHALNLGIPRLAAGRFPPPAPLLLDTPEIGPTEATATSLCDVGMLFPTKDPREHPVWPGSSPIPSG